MASQARIILALVVFIITLAACSRRDETEPGARPPAQSPIVTPPAIATATPASAPTPPINPMPTPSLTPAGLPPGCSVEEVSQLIDEYLSSFNLGELERLRRLFPSTGEPLPSSWYAVVARDEAGVATGTFATSPEDFLRYVAQRHERGERLEPLEFVDIRSLGTTSTGGEQVSVTMALLRQAQDLLARPVLVQLRLSCPDREILALGIGDSASNVLPESPAAVLEGALRQRPLRLPELSADGECPRSPWAFGLAIGEGPVYLPIGPDGVVNLGGPLVAEQEDGTYRFKSSWFVSPDYSGPLLIRGRQLDGSSTLRLASEGSSEATDELFLPPAIEGQATRDEAGWTSWPTAITLSGPGCYAIQVDGADFQQVIVFQAIAGTPDEVLPLPPPESLPRGLVVLSAFRAGPDQVRLALWHESLVIRLSVGLSGPGPLELAGATECVEDFQGTGPVCWQADAEHGWPQAAVWDDSRRRYHLVVLEAEPGSWSQEDLLALIRAFTQASGVPAGG
ncbi:hypothetical protein HRbin26_01447 [bacterium HR26]|nr:hypothetical protein HRbin26_01447 [bacterium HR26]